MRHSPTMSALQHVLPAVALCFLAVPTSAQTHTAPSTPTAPAAAGEPAVQRTVLEDDAVRIEELKVRGQTTRVVVRSKQLDVRAYELLIGDAGRDPSQRGRASGQRVWNLFSF